MEYGSDTKRVVIDTTKIQLFKQITTMSLGNLLGKML